MSVFFILAFRKKMPPNLNRKGWSHLIEKDQYSQGKQNEEQPKSISIRFLAYGSCKRNDLFIYLFIFCQG